MNWKSTIIKIMVVVLVNFMSSAMATVPAAPYQARHFVDKTIKSGDSEVSVRYEWLNRPGEMAVTIDYYGYLIQEGMVNLYLEVNGEAREFVTLRQELPNRKQRIRLISYRPLKEPGKVGSNALLDLGPHEVVDHLLFRNAPYYAEFGEVRVEMKFFAHGRWDGDLSNNNGNYVFSFKSPISGEAAFHF